MSLEVMGVGRREGQVLKWQGEDWKDATIGEHLTSPEMAVPMVSLKWLSIGVEGVCCRDHSDYSCVGLISPLYVECDDVSP